MNILSVAYPLAPVRPDTAGGAEQVLATLDEALVRAGHRSIVVAAAGSRVAGTLVETPLADGPLDERARDRAWACHRDAIARALECHPVDLVHLHGQDFPAYLPPEGMPVLATLHVPRSWYPPEVLCLRRPRTWMHCVSASQRRTWPAHFPLLPEIENGIPLDRLRTHVRRRGFALALGRIAPEKGFHLALDAARRAAVPLLLAGEVYRYAEHERYFRNEIRPRLDAARRFLGPVGWERKRRLLAAARCLLAPSQAPETSSLVAMEALACGTPVIAFPSGALAEIVEHGRTGFLVRDADEMTDAIAAAGALDPEDCRRAARERFSAERMTARYFDTYRRLVHGD